VSPFDECKHNQANKSDIAKQYRSKVPIAKIPTTPQQCGKPGLTGQPRKKSDQMFPLFRRLKWNWNVSIPSRETTG
jgi:hypothetical protein